jgi:hypothetical protein
MSVTKELIEQENLQLQDSVLISKFCIGKIGHFNKREKENGLAHEI